MRRSLRSELLNLPNAITLTRIALIPVFLWFTYYESRVDSFIAALVYAGTSATDFLDGWVARRLNRVTVIGKFLDPLADKLIVMAALVMLVHLGRIGAWVVIVVMGREFLVTGLRTIAVSEGLVIPAGQEGKVKTALQLAGISFLLLHYTYPIDAWFFSFDLDANRVGTWLVYLSLIFSVLSAGFYFRDFARAVYRRDEESAHPERVAQEAGGVEAGPGRAVEARSEPPREAAAGQSRARQGGTP